MKIYLASRYSRRQELCGYRAELESAGHAVTSRWLNGGRHVEFGIALGLNRHAQRRGYKPEFRIIVVGHRENVFYCLSTVEVYETWEDAKAALGVNGTTP